MSIAHLTSVHPRDDVRIFIRQCQTLALAGIGPVTLYVADGKGDEQNGEVSVRDVGDPPAGRIGRAVFGNIRLIRAVLRDRPKVVHFHDPELIIAGFTFRLAGMNVIYDVHEDVPRQMMAKHWIPVWLRWPVARAVASIEWLAGRVFTAIVPATPHIARRFPKLRTHLVQNFPSLEELSADITSPYTERPLAFVYIGSVAMVRGAREMVQAIGLLNRTVTATLHIAGGVDVASLEAELRDLEGWNHVRFHGWIDRPAVKRLLDDARAGLVVLHPIRNYLDSQPIKMFEYMAAGLPVIASDFPLWRHLLGEATRNAILVDPLDTQRIAAAMKWILDHPTEAEVLGRSGQQAVTARYNWQNESRTLVNLYREMLN